MKSYVLVASTAVLATASDVCDNYTTWNTVWDVYDNCFYYYQRSTCEYICDYGHCDSWWLDFEIEDACIMASDLEALGWRNKRSSATVNLASKGVHAEA